MSYVEISILKSEINFIGRCFVLLYIAELISDVLKQLMQFSLFDKRINC